MLACTWILLFGTIAYTNSSPVTPQTGQSTVENVTVPEVTVPEFQVIIIATNGTDSGENDTDTGENDNGSQPYATVETFTDFVQELVAILNTYNDDIFNDFVTILDKEVKKHFHKGGNEFKKQLAAKLNLLMKKPIPNKREDINQIVEMMRLLKIFDRNVKELLDYLNSLYRDDAKEKFQNILTGLKAYTAGYDKSKTKYDFTSLIRECVRATVFIQTNLNTNVRQELRKYIDTYLKNNPPTSTVKSKKAKSLKSVSKSISIKGTKERSSKVKKPKPTFRSNNKKTKAHVKEKNKTTKALKVSTKEAKHENTTVKLKTSKGNVTTPPSKIVFLLESVDLSTKATKQKVMFYMTTEKPAIVYDSESRSKVVKKMLEEESADRQATDLSNTSQAMSSLTKNNLRRRITPSMPHKALEEKHNNTNVDDTLNEYMERMKLLEKEVNRLKTIDEINHYSEANKEESNIMDKATENKHRYDDKQSKSFQKHIEPYGYEVDDANEAETSSEPNGQTVKGTILGFYEPPSTPKDSINVSEDMKQDGGEERVRRVVKLSEIHINEKEPYPAFRRFKEAFPTLFEGHELIEGLYPAHLWD